MQYTTNVDFLMHGLATRTIALTDTHTFEQAYGAQPDKDRDKEKKLVER